jgi:hypothetical protein
MCAVSVNNLYCGYTEKGIDYYVRSVKKVKDNIGDKDAKD